jgi:hypothetical protein
LNIVHWKDIVEKHYGNVAEFIKITNSMLYCQRADLPIKSAFKDVSIDKQAAYDKTRWFMRTSGWFSGYMEKDEMKFFCTVPLADRKYITLSQYMDELQSAGLEDSIDQYYQEKNEVVDRVASGMSEPHKRKDIYDDEGGYIE